MSDVFHINVKTGEVGKCSAKKGKCPFGGATGADNHYTSEEAARSAFEREMADGTFKKRQKAIAAIEAANVDEKSVRKRINSGDLQNGDRITIVSEDGKPARPAVIKERPNGELVVEVAGDYARRPQDLENDGFKIIAREGDTLTVAEGQEILSKLTKERNRLRNPERIAENETKRQKALEKISEAAENARDYARQVLADLTDDDLSKRDRNARDYAYEAQMSDYSIGSINRADSELQNIKYEVRRRREDRIANGDRPYSDGTKPSEYGDDPGYVIATDSGGKFDNIRNGYVFPNGTLIEEKYVDGRGLTFIAGGKNYPNIERALSVNAIIPVLRGFNK